ncbi:MAG: two-component system nitrogen regulation response regulator NtrX, partial [Planctomycetota bacterium]
MTTQAVDTAGDQPQTILVVDDDGDIRVALEMLLQYEGFDVWTARDGNEALKRLEKEREDGRAPVLILTDVKMPGLDGMGLLEELQKRAVGLPVVMISGHADVAMAVDAVRRGAVDILEKPLDQNRVLISIRSALRQGQLKLENTGLRKQLSEQFELCGDSPAITNLRGQIERVAPSNAPVLISGENGTGKEIVARNLHLSSPRVAGQFVAVNCAAIPSELIESELFGHERG